MICTECGDEFTKRSQLIEHMNHHRKELLALQQTHLNQSYGKNMNTFNCLYQFIMPFLSILTYIDLKLSHELIKEKCL